MITNLKLHRPLGYAEDEVQILGKIAHALFNILRETQAAFMFRTLALSKPKLEELATVLVEFAEDVINGLGIWTSLEEYNRAFFKNALPFSQPDDTYIDPKTITRERIHYFLWNMYSEFFPGLTLSPGHADLDVLVESVFQFFNKHDRGDFPRVSSIKAFFHQPIDYGWEVKQKLLWLGRHTYLFRLCYANYLATHGNRPENPIADDFVCQHASYWSGLTVPDILAAVLKLPNDQHDELRSWHLRHYAYYRIEKIEGPILQARNTVCDKVYTIRTGMQREKYKLGHSYLGNLVPWKGQWYWSGGQYDLGTLAQDVASELREKLLRKTPQITYRYCNSLLQKARKNIQLHYQDFVKVHGDDLAVFPNSNTAAAAMQKYYRGEYRVQPPIQSTEEGPEHLLERSGSKLSYSSVLLNAKGGIGVFFNQHEGLEVMHEFNTLCQGLGRRGIDMMEHQKKAIRAFIESPAISPRFVEKLIKKYGTESITKVYGYIENKNPNCMPYILRRYKGHFFRTRYPTLSFA